MKEMIFKRKDFDWSICNAPKENETVSVQQSDFDSDCYIIIGYELTLTGVRQHFFKNHFVDVIGLTNSVTRELVKELTENDKLRQIEKEKIFSLTEKF